jgi:flagellar protein FliL
MAGEEEVEAEAAPGGSKKLIWIAGASVLLLAAAAAATFFVVTRPPAGEEAEAGAEVTAEATPDGAEGAAQAGPTTYSLESMVVNIFDGERDRFLKIGVNLEVSSGDVSKELEERLPQVKDLMISLISSQAYADIRSLEGKTALREQLMTRLNAIVRTGVVRQVFFTEFVVQ